MGFGCFGRARACRSFEAGIAKALAATLRLRRPTRCDVPGDAKSWRKYPVPSHVKRYRCTSLPTWIGARAWERALPCTSRAGTIRSFQTSRLRRGGACAFPAPRDPVACRRDEPC